MKAPAELGLKVLSLLIPKDKGEMIGHECRVRAVKNKVALGIPENQSSLTIG